MATTNVFLVFLVMATVTHVSPIGLESVNHSPPTTASLPEGKKSSVTNPTASPTNTQSENLKFTVYPDTTIYPRLTDALNLTCTFSKSAEDTSNVDLLIYRHSGDYKSKNTDIAYLGSNLKVRDVESGWHIERMISKTELSLTINWNQPSVKQAGLYICVAYLKKPNRKTKTTQNRKLTIVSSMPSFEAQCKNFNFAVYPDTTIYPGQTDSLNLTCTFSKSAVATSDVRLIIKRRNGYFKSKFTEIAYFDSFILQLIISEPGWTSKGINTETETYVTINFNQPSLKQAGLYICEAALFDVDIPNTYLIQDKKQTIVPSMPSVKAQCKNFNFAVYPDTTIYPGLTDSLNLTCSFSKCAVGSSARRLIIRRQNGDSESNFTEIAIFDSQSLRLTISEPGWTSKGINTVTETYVTINWNQPSVKQTGIYTCEAALFDKNFVIPYKNQTIVSSMPSVEAQSENVNFEVYPDTTIYPGLTDALNLASQSENFKFTVDLNTTIHQGLTDELKLIFRVQVWKILQGYSEKSKMD